MHLDSDRPGAPLGTVVGVAGRFGRPGFIAAFDVKNGKRVWQFDTTQPGWEGQYAPTTPDGVPLNRDIAVEQAAAPNFPDAWRYGGGSSWPTPAYDPALGMIYIGVGNPSPQAAGETRPGDNLYTVSLLALDVHTGKRIWHYQLVPHDVWGYDVASPPVLFDAIVDRKSIPAVGHASKLGWYYTLDRRDGPLLFKTRPGNTLELESLCQIRSQVLTIVLARPSGRRCDAPDKSFVVPVLPVVPDIRVTASRYSCKKDRIIWNVVQDGATIPLSTRREQFPSSLHSICELAAFGPLLQRSALGREPGRRQASPIADRCSLVERRAG